MAGGSKRPRSCEVTEGPERAPARAMLRAVGFSEDDFGKAQVAVASSAGTRSPPATTTSTSSPRSRRRASRQGGAVPIEFTTIAVSDGIAMGHEGMKASLMSRDLIADSVELVMHAERIDALVGIAGLRQVRARHADGDGAHEPAVASTSTAARSCRAPTRAATSRSRTCSRRWARTRRARSTTRSCSAIERAACPGTGSCAGMYTANTMAAVGEALGMSLPGSASPPAVDYRREVFARESGTRAAQLVAEGGPLPRDILTKRGLRERDRRRDGGGRLDERGAAPARDRARGPRRPAARRLRPDRAAPCRTSWTSAPRAGS